jgi:hypothetical protein
MQERGQEGRQEGQEKREEGATREHPPDHFSECFRDMTGFIVWVGKTEARSAYHDWVSIETYEKEKSFNSYWMKIDLQGLPDNYATAIRSFFYHLFFFLFWCGVCRNFWFKYGFSFIFHPSGKKIKY